MKIKICLFILIVAVTVGLGQQRADTLTVPYDPALDEWVSIDGYVDVEENEYPGSFRDPVTGITVYWGCDDSLIYLALEAKGKGWLAIGFGSPVMNGANMLIGYYTDDSAVVVNHVGKGKMHATVKGTAELLVDWDVDYDEETNTTTMEFIYPLNWEGLTGTAITGITHGGTYDLILARNAKSVSFAAKHGQKSSYRFHLLAPRPGVETKDQSTQEQKGQ